MSTSQAPSTATWTPIVEASKDSRDKTLVVRQVTPEITTFSVPFTRGGFVPIGGRSTLVRLPTSELFVYVSHPYTPATAEIVSKSGGQVKWLVAPDGEHGMYIQEWSEVYPDAKPIGVERQAQSKPNVKWAGLFGAGGESLKYGFEDHISLHQVSSHVNHELVAIHHPSGTLIQGDMLFNLPPTEQYTRAGGLPIMLKVFGGGSTMSPGGWAHDKALAGIVKDKVKIKSELASIQAVKWDRVIPCHGDVIETGGRVAWDKLWAKYS